MKLEYELISKDKIHLIKDLWEMLNKIHLNDSNYFKEHYSKYTFEERIKNILVLSCKDIRIEIVKSDKRIIAYSLSIISGGNGSIESLFIEDRYRGMGIGNKLVTNCIDWFHSFGCDKITVEVVYGHESVFGFYEKLGFYPKLTKLQLKKEI